MTTKAKSTIEDSVAVAGWRHRLDQAYGYLMGLYVLAVLFQVFLAGVGAFGDHATKVANASSFDPHRALGTVLGFVAVGLFLVAVAVRASGARLSAPCYSQFWYSPPSQPSPVAVIAISG